MSLDPSLDEVPLTGHLAALADSEGALALADVQTQRFEPVSPVLSREELRPEAVWLRLELAAPAGAPTTWALETPAERVDVYWERADGGIERRVAGVDVSKAERSVQQGYPGVVHLTLDGGETRTVWARVRHDPDGSEQTSALRPLRLKPADVSARHTRALTLTNGLFFGFLLALALYNLSLYSAFRDASFLYYVAFVVGIGVYFFSTYRYAFDVFWPAHAGWTPWVQSVSAYAATACYPLFLRSFLTPERTGPVLSRLLAVGAALVGLGLVVIVAAGWEVGAAWTSVWLLVVAAVSLTAMWKAWRGGFRPAGVLLVSFMVVTASTVGFLAPQFGLPQFEWAMQMVQVGVAFEALLLALALTWRVRGLRAARAEAIEGHRRAEEANVALREALQLKANLLGFAAHDLRSPLANVLGFAGRIRTEAADRPEIAAHGERVHRSASRLLQLIDDLLTTAALDGGHLRIEPEPVDLGLFVTEAAEPFEPLAAAKGQRLVVHASDGCHACIDPERFREVVDNLVSNAVKFTPRGGLVEVEVRGTRREVWLCVGDSGPGLTADDRAQLFRPFTRLSAQPTAGESSTGLGLSIVKQIVELHGGRVDVDTEPGRGARFTVVLDAAPRAVSECDVAVLVGQP